MTKHYRNSIVFVLASLIGLGTAQAQTPAASPATTPAKSTSNRVIGEVTTLDPSTGKITLKGLDGQVASLRVDEQTTYRRIPLGETTLEHAVPITFNDLGIGDRVRIAFMSGTEPLLARGVIVISKTDVTQKLERERAEWLKRGVVGRVTAINADTKEITLLARSQDHDAPIVITTQGKVNFRRYSPDSIRFSDTRPSTFAEIKVGDQLRSLGTKSADAARFTPEEIV